MTEAALSKSNELPTTRVKERQIESNDKISHFGFIITDAEVSSVLSGYLGLEFGQIYNQRFTYDINYAFRIGNMERTMFMDNDEQFINHGLRHNLELRFSYTLKNKESITNRPIFIASKNAPPNNTYYINTDVRSHKSLSIYGMLESKSSAFKLKNPDFKELIKNYENDGGLDVPQTNQNLVIGGMWSKRSCYQYNIEANRIKFNGRNALNNEIYLGLRVHLNAMMPDYKYTSASDPNNPVVVNLKNYTRLIPFGFEFRYRLIHAPYKTFSVSTEPALGFNTGYYANLAQAIYVQIKLGLRIFNYSPNIKL